MNFLDRAIAVVSPARAARRVEARAKIRRMEAVQNVFEAATRGRRTAHWRASIKDANTENGPALARLRDVSRDMVRNNPFAAKAKMVIANNVVGSGIVPRIEVRNRRASDLIRAHLETPAIDADGRHNIYGIQSLAMATIVESGAVLIRRRQRERGDRYPLPFQVQVLEPDYIDISKDGKLDNGNYAVQGVEFDLIGRRVAYWLFREHPGSFRLDYRNESSRVSADNILHIYRVDRPGQVHGVSWFAPVVVRMQDLKDYSDAQLMRQKIAACFAAFVRTSEGFEGSTNPDLASPYRSEMLEPGIIERLGDGEDITFAQPPQVSDSEYVRSTHREIAAGLGVTYEALTGDLSGVNFSSGRMGWIEFHRNIEAWRWNMLIPQMLEPIAQWTSESAGLTIGTSVPIRITWTPPRREMIDPTKEINAARDSIRAGLTSRSEEIRRMGYDAEEVDAEIAADNARIDRLGIGLDSDARVKVAAPSPAPAPPADDDPAPQLVDEEE